MDGRRASRGCVRRGLREPCRGLTALCQGGAVPEHQFGRRRLGAILSFTLEEFSELRPYAYHVCGADNFGSIRESRTLKSARTLLAGTEHEHLLRQRRARSARVRIGGRCVEIRDHRPLAPGSLDLPDGYSIEDFVDELNSRVFLWAGTDSRPASGSGRNHFARYSGEGEVYVLRVPVGSLLRANPDREPQVTFCNSGSARHQQGRPVRRGPNTFVSPSTASRRAAKVVELTFRDQVALPTSTRYAGGLEGPWVPLWANA